ncbi:GILT-like protein 1 [Leguminivora glycinivorella]|uniref:GILT-like protein 1 n=1 Tax=Leguminivora glycinivorella TaxID=1035111 RepID=UPI00200E35C4|nr:GILT-like protein 1 [Leguminivora glycinivorella]
MEGYWYIALVLVFGNMADGVREPEKVLLSVYYESQCVDSKVFILKQLRPALQLLNKHIKLQLIPFGKSRSINYGEDGFECQHGPSECLGNIVQDCALNQMQHQSNLEQLAYVACEMETEAGSRGSFECVQKAGLRTELVDKCLNTRQGTGLQLDSEYMTLLMRPKFIPTVAVNLLFDQHVQDNALIDLTDTLCAEPLLEKTAACAHYYNTLAMKHLLSYSLDDNPDNIPLYKYQTYFYID